MEITVICISGISDDKIDFIRNFACESFTNPIKYNKQMRALCLLSELIKLFYILSTISTTQSEVLLIVCATWGVGRGVQFSG